MNDMEGYAVYTADEKAALEGLIAGAGGGGSQPFIKFSFVPRESSEALTRVVRFALNDPPRSIKIKTNKKDELYLAYMCDPKAANPTGAPPATDPAAPPPPQRSWAPFGTTAHAVQNSW